MRTPKTVLRGVFVCFILLGAIILANGDDYGLLFKDAGASDIGYNYPDLLTTEDPTPTATPTPEFFLHLPLAMKLGDIELIGAWTKNSEGKIRYGFHPGDELRYVVEVANYSGYDVPAEITWSQVGPCEEETLVMHKKINLETGVRKLRVIDIAPDCYGVFTNSIDFNYGIKSESFEFRSVVIYPSSIITVIHEEGELAKQGFDKCSLPSVAQMGTWWKESPYSTVNIYLGGISAGCPMDQDSGWLYEVAEQGWSFILTWVGPQAPCTGFNHQMSRDPEKAYQQGRNEAEAAVETAKRIGFLGEDVIYYDVESYSAGKDDPVCREAVASLLQGWTERLHELGYKSGAYGAACTSFVFDWAGNDDPPDDVWLAHWNSVFEYDPEATVWDAPCLSNDLWVHHQRLKQYTGGHKETWGDLQFTIDSNVLDGQVSTILSAPPTQGSALPREDNSSVEMLNTAERMVSDFQLISPTEGWIAYGDGIYWTADGGLSWKEITPPSIGQQQILDVYFLNERRGWSVIRANPGPQSGAISILRTEDGGLNWADQSLPGLTQEESIDIAKAFLEFINTDFGWIALKQQSSSNFSLGRLFATLDGGLTWEERSLPLGEAVEFLDADRGWVAGGPTGDQLFRTIDGGGTWQFQDLHLTGSDQREIGLPSFDDHDTGTMKVVEMNEEGLRMLTFTTADAGESWVLSETKDLPEVGSPLAPNLLTGEEEMGGELPLGAVALDLVDKQHGWALVQEGVCTGYKPPAGEISPSGFPPLQCESRSELLVTNDGGLTWQSISPPD